MKRFYLLTLSASLSLFTAVQAESPSSFDAFSADKDLIPETVSFEEELKKIDQELANEKGDYLFEDEFFDTPDSKTAPSLTAKAEPKESKEAPAVFLNRDVVPSLKDQPKESVSPKILQASDEIETRTPPPIIVSLPKDTESAPAAQEISPALAAKAPVPNFNLAAPQKEKLEKASAAMEINFNQVFSGSPVIYTLLFVMSVSSVCIFLYSLLSLRSSGFLSDASLKEIRNKLYSNQYEDALDLCNRGNNFFCKMVACGIESRKHGLQVMLDSMKAEGKRATVGFWQRLGLLNDIAIIAPMLGLLGTVLGMFYAFYDLNRSMESVTSLFDGLGISVGTTVAGLIVAILSMILHSLTKHRLVRILAVVENEAHEFATLIDSKTSIFQG